MSLENNVERRVETRRPITGEMRIYSSVKKSAYTVKVLDISAQGAFVQSPHLPGIGEIVSFELYDQFYRPFYLGNARVCRLNTDAPRDQLGFGLTFDGPLTQSELESF